MYRIVFRVSSFLLTAFLLFAARGSAQSVAYRQSNLTSDVTTPGFANHINTSLRNSWGITALPGLSFLTANPANGRVVFEDPTGLNTGPAAFAVPSPAGSGPGAPMGVVSDPNAFFGRLDAAHSLTETVLLVTSDGGIYRWGVNPDGSIPTQANLMVDRSASGAVYTGAAILKADCCAAVLAVANFHSGVIETYDTNFVPLGSLEDSGLPPGFSPFALQVIGNQLFVASATQDAEKRSPVFGAGNGIVSVFDLQGHFVRRFATAGPLNAPWGMAQAGASFGPFSNDILIGNVGDGTVNAFDPASGNFAGQLKDGDGNVLSNSNLHGLLFGSAAFGDPNTLYFAAGINDGRDGLFGAITAGLVSTTRISAQSAQIGNPTNISVTVSAGPGNQGTPTGSVTIEDGDTLLATPALVNGVASFSALLSTQGSHAIKALYSGDATFLGSSAQMEVPVTGFPTTLTLAAQANVDPGSVVTLTATISSPDGVPSGEITFLEGGTSLGTAALDLNGVAVLRLNTLAVGAHSLTASYPGDSKFAPSSSAAVTVQVANPDFSLSPASASANVAAGQSTQFTLTVTPVNGFANRVGFSCSAATRVTCTFNPSSVKPANGTPVSTNLTVTTSAGAANFGLLPRDWIDPRALIALLLLCVLLQQFSKLERKRASLLTATAVLALAVTAAAGCGGYGGGSGTPSSRRMVTITVTAQSASVSRTSTLNVTVQ